jgi:hypothetical protein
MRFDSTSLMDMQRRAFAALSSPTHTEHVRKDKISGAVVPPGVPVKPGQELTHHKRAINNPHYVPAKLTSSPGMLVQELPWTNAQTIYEFDFSINGPQQTPGVNNNLVIAKNDVFAIYAVQMLFGTGTNSASFIYRSHGVLPNDDAVYNSFLQIKTESSTYVDKMEGQFFRDNPANSNEYFGEIGMQIINPIRIVSGELGVFKVILNLKNPISTLVISANTVVSMRLHGVYGLARG